MKTNQAIGLIIAIVAIIAVAVLAFDVKLIDHGELPTITAEGGKMPEVDVKGPEVNVTTKEKTVEVPKLEVTREQSTVTYPSVDVKLPDSNGNVPQEASPSAGQPVTPSPAQ